VKDGHLEYGAEVRIGVGTVVQHHLNGRGRMPAGPAFEVNCSTKGGMSGGPAFDSHGKVVGILSTSVDEADGRGPSYVSLLAHALAFKITAAFLPMHFPGKFRLLDLEPHFCGIDQRDAIQVVTDPDTGIERVGVTW
jgi:hypothetical protein